jgi:hypothetical protein
MGQERGTRKIMFKNFWQTVVDFLTQKKISKGMILGSETNKSLNLYNGLLPMAH